MTPEQALKRIEPILRELFDEYDGPVSSNLDARSVEQWDSLANVQLVVMVEKEFGVKFSTAEITNLRNLGELANLVTTKHGL
jgi:acyl carrier protein